MYLLQWLLYWQIHIHSTEWEGQHHINHSQHLPDLWCHGVHIQVCPHMSFRWPHNNRWPLWADVTHNKCTHFTITTTVCYLRLSVFSHVHANSTYLWSVDSKQFYCKYYTRLEWILSLDMTMFYRLRCNASIDAIQQIMMLCCVVLGHLFI